MGKRFLCLWLVVVVLCLAAFTLAERRERVSAGLDRADAAARAVAADWLQRLTLEPDLPLDRVPRLEASLPSLIDPGLGLLGAAVVLPSGMRAATLGIVPALPSTLAPEAPFAGPRATTATVSPATTGMGPVRLLLVPLRDWTGLLRGTLVLTFGLAPEAPGGSDPWRWPMPESAVVVLLATLLVAVERRHRRRRLRPAALKAALGASLAVALTLCTGTAALRAARIDRDGATAILQSVGPRLGTVPTGLLPETARTIGTPRDPRLARLAGALPDFVSLSLGPKAWAESASRSAEGDAFAFDLGAGQKRWLLARVGAGLGAGTGLWLLLKGGAMTLAAVLVTIESVPLLRPGSTGGGAVARTPQGVRRRIPVAGPERGWSERPLVFLVACASSALWPALTRSQEGSGVTVAAAAAGCCIVVLGAGALLGAGFARRIAGRYGWRVAALPGTLCGLAGVCALLVATGVVARLPVWLTIEFGGGLAATALSGIAGASLGLPRRRGPGLLAAVSGLMTGLAIGALSHSGAGDGWALGVGTVLWAIAAGAVFRCRNDGAATFRYFATRPDDEGLVIRGAETGIRGVAHRSLGTAPAGVARWLQSTVSPALGFGPPRVSSHVDASVG